MTVSLAERDQRVIWHPFTPQKYAPEPIGIVKGDGPYLTDDKGQSYLDAISSWWVTLHGHAHPYIAKRLYEQACTLEQVIFAGFTHEPAVRLAERLLTRLPDHFARIFYSDNGSTSTEVALKMAIQYWWNRGERKRNKILAFRNAYHGDTFGAMSVSERSVFTLAFHDYLFEVIFLDPPYAATSVPAQLETVPLDEVACFIYEPLVQGAGGMKMYDPGALNELLEIFAQYQVICIADEVMTGFGRTGKLFASEYCRQKPDILCMSKGLTGGTMALGATACTAEIYAAYLNDDKLKTFFHGHSFTANPLACTAALASLDLLEDPACQATIDTICRRNQQFIVDLNTVHTGLGHHLKNLRCLGTILAFEIDRGPDEYLNDIGGELTRQALQRGVYLRPLGNTVYIMPPYCFTEAQLDRVYDTLIAILEGLQKKAP